MNENHAPERFAPIRTYTPTIMDGQVIRWYRFPSDPDHGRGPVVSASRNMVTVDASVIASEQSEQLIETIRDAVLVMNMIRRGEDVAHLATPGVTS